VSRLTHTVIRLRWLVVGAWVVVLVLSLGASQGLGELLTNRFTLPGTDTRRAEQILEERFGVRSNGAFIVVVQAPEGVGPLLPQVRQSAERAAAAVDTGHVESVLQVSPTVASATIATALEQVEAKPFTDDVRAALGAIPGAEVLVTGQPAIETDLEPVQDEDLKRGELYVAVPIALCILVAVFGTAAFLIPFALAFASIFTTLGVVWIFAQGMELSTYVTNLVQLIGLGVAVDYSLLVVQRYREERRAGRSREDAVVRTMETAGRAVVFSGTAVGIGLALLIAMPLPFIRGFGVAGLLIPIVSVVAAVTLLPALLYMAGDRLDRVRLVPRAIVVRRADTEHGFWVGIVRAIMRRPALFATVSTALLVAAAVPAFSLEVGPGTNQGVPQTLESTRALVVLGEAAGEGATAPTELVIDTGRPGGADDPGVVRAIERLRAGLEADAETVRVLTGDAAPFVDSERRVRRVQHAGASEYGTPAAMEFVERLRDQLVPAARFPEGVRVLAGGGPASSVDFLDLTFGSFPWLVLAVLALTYVLLLRAFRSLLLPLKAIVLNLLSIGSAYGLLVVCFKWGAGDAIGLQSYDQIEGWIPVFLFAMLFGLSMDYEVFLVSRMREEWDRDGSNERAVAEGLAKTGRIVTAAGLIMIAAFSGFMVGRVLGLQQFGFGLAVAIAVDVTIVRVVLLPSAMALFGRWNWWLPDGVARLVRVRPSPLAPRARAAISAHGR
jgi:RND superfamily putative drug exporter